MDPLELLAHPVRLRVVHALRGARVLTTGQIAAHLPDVSKATVYRHVDALAGAGVLEVADQRRVRGAVERRYRLSRERATIDAATVRSMSADDHRRAFVAALAALIAEFDGYLDRPGVDPVTDLVGYRQHALWLRPDELTGLIAQLQQALAPLLHNRPAPGRSRYLVSPILFPASE
jgi:DNA-binding transcriptional ArsR family regulator